MIALAVTWAAKAGQEEAVADLFRRLTAESRGEPGCVMYQVHRRREDPRHFFIYEQYDDAAALDAHRAAPHFAYARRELPAIAERVDGQLYDPLD
jgi:quinol monooxygenase YgiN